MAVNQRKRKVSIFNYTFFYHKSQINWKNTADTYAGRTMEIPYFLDAPLSLLKFIDKTSVLNDAMRHRYAFRRTFHAHFGIDR